MNILWAALAICLVVSVVFYALAVSWGRTLRGHSRAIRMLYQRLEALESLEDPFLRRRVSELVPSQLEEVCIFSLNLGEHFWRNSVGATESRAREIRENGTILGSVKLEIWRSHVSVTITELLPASKLAGWQTRVLNIYASESEQLKALWELRLEDDVDPAIRVGRVLQLRFRNRSLELAICGPAVNSTPEDQNAANDERLFFCIPLEPEKLSKHRIQNAESEESPREEATPERKLLLFSDENEDLGIAWRLSIRTLDDSKPSNNWKILEPARVRRIS